MGMIGQAMDYCNRERPGGLRQPGRLTAIKPLKQPRESRPAPSYSVDPIELSRLLSIVLEDQRKCAGRRKRASMTSDVQEQAVAKAPDASTKNPPEAETVKSKLDCHQMKSFKQPLTEGNLNADPQLGQPYIPQEAALQFAVTTTANGMREGTGTSGIVRKLSKSALKFHINKDEQRKGTSGLRSEKSQAKRGRLVEDETEVAARSQNRQADNLMGHLHSTRDKQEENGRTSTGVNLERMAEESVNRHSQLIPESPVHHEETTTPPSLTKPQRISLANEHRVDWTQSDEAKKTRLSPLLRRPVSTWTLRGRLGGKEKGSLIDPDSPTLKSPKYGLFGGRLRKCFACFSFSCQPPDLHHERH